MSAVSCLLQLSSVFREPSDSETAAVPGVSTMSKWVYIVDGACSLRAVQGSVPTVLAMFAMSSLSQSIRSRHSVYDLQSRRRLQSQGRFEYLTCLGRLHCRSCLQCLECLQRRQPLQCLGCLHGLACLQSRPCLDCLASPSSAQSLQSRHCLECRDCLSTVSVWSVQMAWSVYIVEGVDWGSFPECRQCLV